MSSVRGDSPTKTSKYSERLGDAVSWTERNQKADFLGGACAGGCFLIGVVAVIVFLIAAFAMCGDGC